MNRREFLRQTGAAAGALALGAFRSPAAVADPLRTVVFVRDVPDQAGGEPVDERAGRGLAEALRRRGIGVREVGREEDAGPGDWVISLRAGVPELAGTPGSFRGSGRAAGGRRGLAIDGADARGLAMALRELTDALDCGGDPAEVLTAEVPVQKPFLRVRSVLRAFVSEIEDKPWFNDRDFWRSYLELLATHRFNRFSLALGLGYDQPVGLRDTYFYFAYPFLVDVPGYKVTARGLSPRERDANLAQLQWIAAEARACGLDFQLGVWTHAYVWRDSPAVNYVIDGLTPEAHAAYCRDALALVLRECPAIGGVTVRIHGESGVPEGSYGFWRKVFTGCTRDGRPLPLDLHAKGLDEGTLAAARAGGSPLTISPKFWAEHMALPYHQAAIRPTDRPTGQPGRGPFTQSEGSRSFTRYGYGDFLREDRSYAIVHRIWPGTQRVLLWGDPVFAAAAARAAALAGGDGCEIFDPLSFKGRKGSGLPGNREGYADAALAAPGGDFAKHRLTYRVWGRALFDPERAAESCGRQWRADYGPRSGEEAGRAVAAASRILPLVTTAHCPSAANNNYWPEMYVNMALADPAAPAEPYTDTPRPWRFGTVSPLDPQLFTTVEECAANLLGGRADGRYTPLEVADWLEGYAAEAGRLMAAAEEKSAAPEGRAFRAAAIDVRMLSGLGRFFARKFVAGVWFAVLQRTGSGVARGEAVAAYQAAREAWAGVAKRAAGVYVPDLTYGEGWFQRGHWSDRLAAIDRDIAAVQGTPAGSAGDEAALAPVFARIRRPERRLPILADVAAARGFLPGRDFPVSVRLGAGATATAVRLWFRPMNQAETWQDLGMAFSGGAWTAAIPGARLAGEFPLQYYFETRGAEGAAGLYPGLGPDLTRQPYVVVRPERP